MKAQATLAALALLAASQAFAQSSSASAGSYDWGGSQVHKLYESPYARPGDAVASTIERKRLTEARSGSEEKEPASSGKRASAGGKLACLGMGSTIDGKDCHAAKQGVLSLHRTGH